MILIILVIILLVVYLIIKTPTREHLTDNVSLILYNLNNKLETYKPIKQPYYNKLDSIPIYYINLKGSTQRNIHIINQFKRHNITNYTRIEAVNGYNYTTNRGTIENTTLKYQTDYKNYLPGELGATLSHLKTIYTAYKLNQDRVLILEDDISFNLMPFWPTTINNIIINAPADWTIITLYSGNSKCIAQTDKYVSFKKHNCYGALAYIINRTGMINVLKCMKNTTFVLNKDELPYSYSLAADVYIYKKAANTYTYGEYPLFYTYNNTDKMNSTIHTTHTNSHITKAIKTIKTYLYNDNQIRTIWKSNTTTPALIHYIYHKPDAQLYRDINKYHSKILTGNTTTNWQYIIWTPSSCSNLLNTHYKWLIPKYNSFKDNEHRANIMKYIIIYHYGGIYIDITNSGAKYSGLEKYLKPGIATFKINQSGLIDILISPAQHPIYQTIIHNITDKTDKEYLIGIINNYEMQDINITDNI